MAVSHYSDDQFRQHPFFTLLPPEAAPTLVEAASISRIPADTVLFHEGAPSDCLYLVLEGSVRILKSMTADPPYLLTRVEAGGFFGEYGVLDASVRSASAVTAVASTLARIPREPFLHAVQSMPGTGMMQFLHHILNGIRASNNHYVQELIQRARISAVGASLNTILHDFRDPLAVVRITAGILRSQSGDPGVLNASRLIEDQVKRMNDMADEILDFARGVVRMECTPTNISQILERFQQHTQGQLDRAGVALEITPLEAWISADTQKVLRVLQNLINNAAEMLTAGKGRIRIRTSADPEWVLLSVTDNGPGIPKDVRARLFEPFATSGKARGIGLGLPIVKTIMTAHQGTVQVKTATGKGTTFHLRFPRIQPDGTPWAQGS